MSELPEKLELPNETEGDSVCINRPNKSLAALCGDPKLRDEIVRRYNAYAEAEIKSATEKYAREVEFNGKLQKRIADQQTTIKQLVEALKETEYLFPDHIIGGFDEFSKIKGIKVKVDIAIAAAKEKE